MTISKPLYAAFDAAQSFLARKQNFHEIFTFHTSVGGFYRIYNIESRFGHDMPNGEPDREGGRAVTVRKDRQLNA
ncbi:MAG: hypothetical protein ACLVHY_05035 [Gemmiger sp.]